MEDSAVGEAVMPETAMIGTGMEANLDANMDDLFGEAADGLNVEALGVPLPPPIPPELSLRIANMQSRGCCTELAWSRTGSIAQIKDSGRRIVFRALIRDQQTGAWPLTEESKHPIVAGDGIRWEHIQFSNLGTDLAIVDSLGRVAVHTLTGPLGRMPPAPDNINRIEASRGDSNAVVGLHWLPVYPAEFKFPYIGPAVKAGDKWKTTMHHRDSNEPSVHNASDGRSALLHVSRDAKLTLMYQIEAVWHAIDTKLEDVNSSDELISHAAMGEEGDSVLLVTHDLSRRFRLYRITVAWNPTQQPRPGALLPTMTIVAPTISIGRLTVLDHVAAQHADAARITQLRIVPTIPSHATDANTPTSPLILATFSRASVPVDLTQQAPETFSVIARWHVEYVLPTLHEAFTKLKANGTATAPQTTVTSLRRQEDVFTNRLVLSAEPQYFNTMLALVASDGTIEFRDRATMAIIDPFPDPTMVTSLPASGFEHLMDEHHVHVAISGDGSALATANSESKLNHKMMTLRYTWRPVMDDGGLIEAAVVCMARQYAILCCTSVTNDETLALFPLDLSIELRALFVKEIIEMLGRITHIDISMQEVVHQQKMIMQEPLLPKAISAQFVLGAKPGTTLSTFRSKYAFTFLNCRLVATSLAQLISALHSKAQPFQAQAFLRPEFFTSFRGLSRWGADLLVYIIAALVAIRQKVIDGNGTSAKPGFDDYIMEKDSPVIYVLLCTFSRAYLRLLSSCIPKYLTGVKGVQQKARSVSERQQLEEIFEANSSLPFKYSDFEIFVADLDTAIRNAYNQGNVIPERRVEIELSMITCEHPLPDELQPALQALIDTVLPKFLTKVDMRKLYFWDTSWLGIEPQPSGQTIQYDIIRKIPITKDMKLKVCRRCGAMTEDLSQEKTRETAPMLLHAGKYCICASYWIVD